MCCYAGNSFPSWQLLLTAEAAAHNPRSSMACCFACYMQSQCKAAVRVWCIAMKPAAVMRARMRHPNTTACEPLT